MLAFFVLVQENICKALTNHHLFGALDWSQLVQMIVLVNHHKEQ